MAATPPPRSPGECPDAPLWPAKFEQPHEYRRSTRLANRQHKGEPSTPRGEERLTPPPTTKKDKSVGRNLFGTATMQTPKKKKAAMPSTPVSVAKSAKTASRISKFSLDQRSDNPITIFEDSNARIPGPIGEDEDDVFKGAKDHKRRKISKDVEFSSPTEQGMVVVQRGRKVYKAFEEAPIFTGPMPRKRLFEGFAKKVKATPDHVLPDSGPAAPVATDDEETEREESPEPVEARNVRFLEAEASSSTTTTTTTTTRVMATPSQAKPKTPRRVKGEVTINAAFMTPPETLGRVQTVSMDETLGTSGRTSVKRKLSYAASGPLATPESTPAKKRGKTASGEAIARDANPFASSPPSPMKTRRGAAKSRS